MYTAKQAILTKDHIPDSHSVVRDIQNLYLQVMEKIFSEISTRVALYNKAEAKFAKREWTDIEKKKGTHVPLIFRGNLFVDCCAHPLGLRLHEIRFLQWQILSSASNVVCSWNLCSL